MTKQEFLAMSLPYGLKCKDSDLLESNSIYKYIGSYYQMDNEIEYKNVKPILHPLTDLTKEIEYNGEKFVPLYRLLENNYFDLTKMSEQDVLAFEGAFTNPELITLYDLLLYLKWHFDLFNGIENGEAIDVNTLDENPYK